jgi:hypothetical protein
MNNIERFEIYAAYFLAKAYEDFPMGKTFDPQAVVKAVGLKPGKPSDAAWENTFALEGRLMGPSGAGSQSPDPHQHAHPPHVVR